MMSKSLSLSFMPMLLQHLLKLRSQPWWLSLIVWIVLVGPAQAAVQLRVAIDQGSNIQVGSSTDAIVRNSAGEKVGEIAAMNSFSATPSSGNVSLANWQSQQLWIEPSNDGYVWIDDRWYRGSTQLVPTGNGVIAINHVDIEQYLASVVGAEMIASWPQEALKAQAVAARSYALYERSKSNSPLFDLGNTQGHQVYKGITSETNTTQAAVAATSGQVMTYNGKVILAAFHASSGGHTENVEDVWIEPLPYLRGVPDFDQGTPSYQWTKSFSSSELGSKISGVGNVTAIAPIKVTPNGRIETVQVRGTQGTRTMDGDAFRQALSLKSALFTAVPTAGGFQLNGKGFGHGIGMSQWGAYNLASQGTNYQQILSHYYQNTTLAVLPR
jgi:stage II sporulation protein D